MTYQFHRAVDSLETAIGLKFERRGHMILLSPDFHNAINVPVALLSVANELYDVYALFTRNRYGHAVVVAISVSKIDLLDYAQFYSEGTGGRKYRGNLPQHDDTYLRDTDRLNVFRPADIKSNLDYIGICHYEKRHLALYTVMGFSPNINPVDKISRAKGIEDARVDQDQMDITPSSLGKGHPEVDPNNIITNFHSNHKESFDVFGNGYLVINQNKINLTKWQKFWSKLLLGSTFTVNTK